MRARYMGSLLAVALILALCQTGAIAQSVIEIDDPQIRQTEGFGDPHNSYVWSMAWFQGKLFAGTNRDIMVLKGFEDIGLAFDPWPVDLPSSLFVPDADLRGQIWCYTQGVGWEMVYQSPFITLINPPGEQIARDSGYRKMVVFTDQHGVEALYIACAQVAGPGAHILRTVDGVNFEVVSEPGLIPGLPDGSISSIRDLVPYKGKLYTTPVGSSGSGNTTEVRQIFESDDPASGVWRVVSEPGFGDDWNLSVFEMEVFNGYLYAGTLNPDTGFQIWKTYAEGTPPYDWQLVLRDGAGRGNLNELAHTMEVHDGYLYVGADIQNGGHDLTYNVGYATSELLRLAPDDSWEIVVGTARNTRDGYKTPISGFGLGFGNMFNGYMWRMRVYDGWIYVGTFDASRMVPYIPVADFDNSIIRHLVAILSPEFFVNQFGGADLWRSQDGVKWHRVTTTGFDNPNNFGIRSMAVTPMGLFVGTANPFTEAGVKTPEYPLGGGEVRLLRHDHSADMPTNLTATVVGGQVELTWDWQGDDAHFHVVRSLQLYNSFPSVDDVGDRIGITDVPHYVDANADANTRYYYAVIAEVDGDYSEPSNILPVYVDDSALPVVFASIVAVSTEDGIMLQWETVQEYGNLGFNVYRSEPNSEGFIKVNSALIPASRESSTVTEHSYTWLDDVADPGVPYQYMIEDVSWAGVTHRSLPVRVTIQQRNQHTLPTRTALYQNYPNAFNPETWIPYELAEAADVTIRIHDFGGYLVKTLRLGHQEAGYYLSRASAAHWDGRNEAEEKVASGVYLYSIQAGDFSASLKMLLMK